MLIINLNFMAEEVAALLASFEYKTLITKEIQWECGLPDGCKPIFVNTLYIVLPDGSLKEANRFLSDKVKLKIFKFLKQAS